MDIGETLSELSNLLRRLLGDNIQLNLVHGKDLGLVKVDLVQFEQVIVNLVVNARDAMPDGGTLTIHTANVSVVAPIRRGAEIMPAGDYVLIEVIDTGTGIPPEIVNRIFEPFFSTKEIGAGTGLGLSTVYGIIKQTGGSIFVDSAPGDGTTFSIYLKKAAPEKKPGTGRGEVALESDLTGAGSILIVEDEDAVRLFSARALRNKGYQVAEAPSGESALAVLSEAESPFDLLITDVMMPQMDGATLIGKVRENWPDIRVICISGYAEDAMREKLEDVGPIHFLSKPFSLKQLAATVKDTLEE